MPKQLNRRTWAKQILLGSAGLYLFSGNLCASSKKADFIGLQTYSLRDRSLDDALAAMIKLGIKRCELWEGHVEPRELMWKPKISAQQLKQNQAALMVWRDRLDMHFIETIKAKFEHAGIQLLAYNPTFKDNIRDQDIDLAFRIAQTLQTDTINSSATVAVMDRVYHYAQQYQIKVGLHNHTNIANPNEFATPESFKKAMEGKSNLIGINFDIGHFTAANYDPLSFIQHNVEHIFSIHVKDRQSNQGAKVPFGKGDTPIKAVLQLLDKTPQFIPAFIEYEYPGEDTLMAIENCLAYCKTCLS